MKMKPVLWAAVAAVSCVTGVVVGQQPSNPLAQPPAAADAKPQGGFANPLEQAVPKVLSAKPPEWVKPGARIVYWTGMGSFTNAGHGLFKPDPNGDIRDTKGNAYSRQEGNANTATGGYMVYTVMKANDRGEATIVVENYSLGDPNGPVTPVGFRTMRADTGTGGGIWMSPQKLAEAKPDVDGAVRVLIGPWPIDGNVYEAVTIATIGSSQTFDKGTGMFLSALTKGKTQQSAGFALDGDKLVPQQGEATHSFVSQFKGFRYQKLPWIGQDRPAWVAKGTTLQYRGTSWFETPGVQPIPIFTDRKYTVLETGDGWTRTEKSTQTALANPFGGPPQPQPPVPNEEAFIADGGDLWISPAVLKTLEPGQPLDEEKLLGTTLAVGQAGRLPDGRDTIELVSRGRTFSHANVYDLKSGVLVQSYSFLRATNMHTRIELVGMQGAAGQ